MDFITNLYSQLPALIPLLFSSLIVGGLLWVFNRRLLHGKRPLGAEAKFPRQLIMLLLSAVGLLIVVLSIPMSESTRRNVLSLLGVVLTALIALSSSTFVANMMAGLMLRLVHSFRPGDFIRVGELFGRVTERGLMHTEIQTEDRDLITFPNLHLVTNPVRVVRSSGTFISATLSLGYDLPRGRIEKLLKKAAETINLQEAFVQVKELGDFSVTYRIAGFLTDVKHLITAQSDLRKKVLDTLHSNGFEIVSPAFMNQRRIQTGQKIIPPVSPGTAAPDSGDDAPDDIIFDKAETAEAHEKLKAEFLETQQKLEELEKQEKTLPAGKKSAVNQEINRLKKRVKSLSGQLEEAKKIVESQDT
ncbi:MAG: mechanosensitive ion channel [FCB group bacterium]|nr:mechanosensitive ion channel [FCB group bacterium]